MRGGITFRQNRRVTYSMDNSQNEQTSTIESSAATKRYEYDTCGLDEELMPREEIYVSQTTNIMAKSCFTIFGLLLFNGVYGLRMLQMKVPAYSLIGEKTVLECLYELDGDSLYSIKWYKDNEEFYRYLPSSRPPLRWFQTKGVNVELKESDSQKVVLRAVNLKTSGHYKCEVSAEAPSFTSVQDESYLEVVVLPQNGPQITGEKEQYFIGDELNLNCSSSKSHPASLLKWYINDIQASQVFLRNYGVHNYTDALETSVLGLQMTLTSDHFIKGNLSVRCLATLPLLKWQGDKESILSKADNREAMLLVKSAGRTILPTNWWMYSWVFLAAFIT